MYASPKLSLKPSELIRRQCAATFMYDPVAINNRAHHRRRDAHVGQRLPAPRRHVARVAGGQRRPVRRRQPGQTSTPSSAATRPRSSASTSTSSPSSPARPRVVHGRERPRRDRDDAARTRRAPRGLGPRLLVPVRRPRRLERGGDRAAERAVSGGVLRGRRRADDRRRPGGRRSRPAAVCQRLGVTGVAAVLADRAGLGFAGRTDLASPGSVSTRFRRLDRRVYSPLCLALAAGALSSRRR